ncbi:calmodulin-binding transcription activator 2-like isoform X2 [Ipomoea triloba]|uniref:calmodulin-binding transcription activator 2-like isoform X2 n=1 Tax=Ipomoea triloba TaxID=35885 RepID=UPI00125D9B6D|nr:calmodulin-binding transcription activator 2-like isoform X2 [Ipomoea triloba]
MAESGSDPLGFRLDIKQILLEAQHRWLRPAEISEILRNYKKFHITPEPLYKPVSGSVFLFDRKVLRYFRKDGHNWRKKKDGKTVKEAHEKLKVGSVDMLHCYYAHGEDNENFQRRSYWMLEQDLMHIVFVHYLEVKGNKAMRSIEPTESSSIDESSMSVSSAGNCTKLTSTSADSPSPTSTLTSAYEDVESEYSHPGTSGLQSFPEIATAGSYSVENVDTVPLQYSGSKQTLDLASWEKFLENCTKGDIAYKQDPTNSSSVQTNWQHYSEDPALQFHGQSVHQGFISDSNYDLGRFSNPKSLQEYFLNTTGPLDMYPNETAELPIEMNHQYNPNFDSNVQKVGNEEYSVKKHPLLDGSGVKEGLNKVDSFSRWVDKELGDVEELQMHSSNGISWNVIESEDSDSCIPSQLQLGSDSLNPSLSQEQLFSIIEFSPMWAYSNKKTKVLITGKFLQTEKEVAKCKWSCMFGEVEVPVEVLPTGLLCCYSPPHRAGTVPFYITCSNRLACSEVREFEYRAGPSKDTNASDSHTMEVLLHERFERLLRLGATVSHCSSEDIMEKQTIVNKVIELMEEQNLCMTDFMDLYEPKNRELPLFGKELKERFYTWLLHKINEDGKGPAFVDEEGQGVIHLAAALGYDWALKPILISGVSIDFRDVNGWTPLHWAAFYGWEETVATLVSLGASPGALTDPSAEFPLGRTPADLASANGNKGISGFLAESSLTTHLARLDVSDAKENNALDTSKTKEIQTVTERVAVPTTDNVPDVSLNDSLAAVRNATQAAARIHQIFRVQSFQRKKLIEHNGELLSDEQALSMVASKTSRLGQKDRIAHAAATQIQKKFRGWKKRKEFLLIRQRVVKIQAHVRGHQARKKYKPIIWSVGILEKVILRWRRKGSGLRGFKSDAVAKPIMEDKPASVEDDYDFLKEGRKQTEERMQKALSRVKSMAQYPEAREQYRRMLTATEGVRKTKDASTGVVGSSEDTSYQDEDLLDIETLLDDDTFMSIPFE